MKRLVSVVVIVSAFVLMAACSHKTKVIPEDKFSSIYADMFLADQWLEANYGERKAIDTLFFYDPIFEKYGYNREDYYASVEYYLMDPSKYIKILKKTQKYLESRVPEVEHEIEVRTERERNRPPEAGVVSFAEITKRLPFNDTISLKKDDKGIYSITPIVFDTIFKGPALIYTDKVSEPADSTQVDSLATKLAIDLDDPKLPDEIKRVIQEPLRGNSSNKHRVNPNRGAPPKPANQVLNTQNLNVEKLK